MVDDDDDNNGSYGSVGERFVQYLAVPVNSPGPWPRALKIIGTLSLSYQVTLVTCWAGRGGSLKLVPRTIPALSLHFLTWSWCHFFPFSGHSKNHEKMDPSKNHFFGQFLGLSAFFLLFCHDFWFIWGPSGGIFLTCLAGQIFSCFFIDFSKKREKWKNIKSTF